MFEEQPGHPESGAGTFLSLLPPPIITSLPRNQLLDVARGMTYIHSLGIVHGNLKIVRPILVRRI